MFQKWNGCKRKTQEPSAQKSGHNKKKRPSKEAALASFGADFYALLEGRLFCHIPLPVHIVLNHIFVKLPVEGRIPCIQVQLFVGHIVHVGL